MLKLNSNTLATWCEELTHLKRPWCWEKLRAGGEGNDRGWDGWMASPTQWTWVWVNSGSWWWTGRPGVLQSMGSQRVWHDWMVAQMIKNLPAMQQMWVPSLGREDPLEKGMATHSSNLFRKIPWTEEFHGLVGYTVCGVIKSGTRLSNWHFHFHSILSTGLLALPLVFALGLTICIFNSSQSTFKYE